MKSLAAFLIIGAAISAGAQSLDNTFETALGTAGLSMRTAVFDPGYTAFFSESNFSSLLYRQCYQYPWRTPFIIRTYRDELAAASDRPHDELAICARMLGVPVRRTLLGDPTAANAALSKRPGSLAAVLDRMSKLGLLKGSIPNTSHVPEPVQQAAALYLNTAIDMAPFRRAAFAQSTNMDVLFNQIQNPPVDYTPEAAAREMDLDKNIDIRFLSAGSQDLASACSQAKNVLLGMSETEKFDFKASTVWGDIILSGAGDQTHDEKSVLLLIDTGGNDTYVGLPANQSTTNWTSAVFDSYGNDSYLSSADLKTKPVAQAAGRSSAKGFGPCAASLGFTFLLDIRGNDLYRSLKPGIACAQYGVAVLSDSDGDDTYDCYASGEAYASFGLALIEDLGGKDSYSGFNAVQGSAGVFGFAALVDRGGDDTYLANDSVLDFPSPQTAQHNVSMAQGAGVGRRADYLDGHSLSGGIGLLYDMEGSDTYTAGVFAQGTGYWEGMGMLWDRVGNDKYNGQWYVQAASAHFGIGLLEDENGEDEYKADMNMAGGAGHDFGLGVLLDRNGNDKYTMPNLSLGAGNASGIGIFMDFSGDDAYTALGLTLGRSAESPKGTLRERCLALGLFYDGGGTDTYPDSTNWARNNARITNWTDRNETPAESQLGIFWDR